MNGRINELMSDRMNEWVDKWMDGCIADLPLVLLFKSIGLVIG